MRKTSVAKVWQNYELEKAKLHNIMTVAKLWHMFMDSPAFTELAPEPKRLSTTSEGVADGIRKSAC